MGVEFKTLDTVHRYIDIFTLLAKTPRYKVSICCKCISTNSQNLLKFKDNINVCFRYSYEKRNKRVGGRGESVKKFCR